MLNDNREIWTLRDAIYTALTGIARLEQGHSDVTPVVLNETQTRELHRAKKSLWAALNAKDIYTHGWKASCPKWWEE